MLAACSIRHASKFRNSRAALQAFITHIDSSFSQIKQRPYGFIYKVFMPVACSNHHSPKFRTLNTTMYILHISMIKEIQKVASLNIKKRKLTLLKAFEAFIDFVVPELKAVMTQRTFCI